MGKCREAILDFARTGVQARLEPFRFYGDGLAKLLANPLMNPTQRS